MAFSPLQSLLNALRINVYLVETGMRIQVKISLVLSTILVLIPTYVFAAQFKVIRVYDGDTITAEMSGFKVRVRLVGIDAPETSKKRGEEGQPYSQKAKEHLAGLILNKMVTIISYDLDRYNRVLGEIFQDGKNINLEMVKAGLAEVYTGKPAKGLDMEPYRQAEAEAKKARLEMWSQYSDS